MFCKNGSISVNIWHIFLSIQAIQFAGSAILLCQLIQRAVQFQRANIWYREHERESDIFNYIGNEPFWAFIDADFCARI